MGLLPGVGVNIFDRPGYAPEIYFILIVHFAVGDLLTGQTYG
jgi:hypothetical protein